MMKTTKILGSVVMAAVLAMGTMTGCGDNSQKTVSTDGSTSMEKVIGYLSEAYMDKNSDVKVTYNPTGSGAGIQAVQECNANNLRGCWHLPRIKNQIEYLGQNTLR